MSTPGPDARRRTEQNLAYADRARNIVDLESADLVGGISLRTVS
jgi:hypothetical protein